ncbi:MAG: hypothetical protein AABZ60_11810 [Planctomycetota bacterium]
MNDLVLLESSTLRNKLCREENLAILEQIGQLPTLLRTQFSTAKFIANFYQVPEQTIRNIVFNHKDELSLDGYQILKKTEFQQVFQEMLKKSDEPNILGKLNEQEFKKFLKENFDFPNRGLGLFPKRAVLRIGMLLKESEIGKQIRNYLLTVEEQFTQSFPTSTQNYSASPLVQQAGMLVEHANQLSTHAEQINKHANQLVAQARLVSAIAEEVYQNREHMKNLESEFKQHEKRVLFLERQVLIEHKKKNPLLIAQNIYEISNQPETISSEQIKILKQKVNEKGKSLTVWAKFKLHFEISRYIFLPRNRFQEALDWLSSYSP